MCCRFAFVCSPYRQVYCCNKKVRNTTFAFQRRINLVRTDGKWSYKKYIAGSLFLHESMLAWWDCFFFTNDTIYTDKKNLSFCVADLENTRRNILSVVDLHTTELCIKSHPYRFCIPENYPTGSNRLEKKNQTAGTNTSSTWIGSEWSHLLSHPKPIATYYLDRRHWKQILMSHNKALTCCAAGW